MEKLEAVSQIYISVRPTKLSKVSSQTSLRMMLWLPSVPKSFHVRDWSTGFLAGDGGTTNVRSFAAMINKMVICTGVNIINRLFSVTSVPSNRQTGTVGG